MRLIIFILTLILISNSVSAIKISTFNIQSGVGITKDYWQYLTSFWKYFLPHSQDNIIKTANFINSEKIDVISLTEIDGGSLRSQNINQLKLLSNLTSLNESIFFATYKFGKVINQGNAILSKYPILESKNYRLPGKGEPRYLGMALLKMEKNNLTILVTHLSLDKKDRIEQIKYISEFVNNITTPLILSGDFNINNESELITINNTGLKRAANYKTYPSWNPKICKDSIFVSDSFIIKKRYMLKTNISDHLPIVIEANFD
jgi:endonuclease/exonuclease/phosphatase family metal-dependent hydrolase